MLIPKIAGNKVEIIDSNTRAILRVIMVNTYKGATHAEIRGEEIAITCGDGRIRVFAVKTGALKSVIY